MIAIIDYDAGNIKSVEKALEYLGGKPVVTRDRNMILKADKVVLPGVGAFGDAMGKLTHYDMAEVIHEVVRRDIPLLGICMGLQLLFDRSEEAPNEIQGLSILKGQIMRIPGRGDLKIPHMGWNSLSIKPGTRLFKGIPDQAHVYFVHSYYLKAEDEGIVAATSEYGTLIHAAVERGNIFACQFHPEKSSDVGLMILRNFMQL